MLRGNIGKLPLNRIRFIVIRFQVLEIEEELLTKSASRNPRLKNLFESALGIGPTRLQFQPGSSTTKISLQFWSSA